MSIILSPPFTYVKIIGGQICPYIPYIVLYYNYILNYLIKLIRLSMPISVTCILEQLNKLLCSKKLNSTQKQIFYSLLCLVGDKKKIPISDDQINEHSGLRSQNIRRDLKHLKLQKLISIDLKNNTKHKRLITILLPKNIKRLFLTENQEQTTDKALMFTGICIDQSCYRIGRNSILEIKLKNVCSTDGHINFSTYWVRQDLLIQTNTNIVSFFAIPYITSSERLVLNIVNRYQKSMQTNCNGVAS